MFGFGAIIRLSLEPGGYGAAGDRFALRYRVIDTPTERLHALRPEAFVAGPLGFSSPFGAPNMVNTAPLPWGDRLFVTWDVGRPAELDAVSLRFLGEVGHVDSWRGSSLPDDKLTPFLFSTAHPVVDPDRNCLWTVKLVPVGFSPWRLQPWVVRYDGDGIEVRVWPVAGATITGSMHTITQTRDWLILADSGNFKADPGELTNGVRSVLIDDEVPVFLVRKDRIEQTPVGDEVAAEVFTVSPSTGHFYARYDDSDGVRVLFEHMDRTDLGFHLRADDTDAFGRPVDPALVGFYNMAMAPSSVSEVSFDPLTKTATREAFVCEEWSWSHQLSAMDWSTEGISAPTRHHIVFQGFRPSAISQRALTAYGDRVDRSAFPDDETAACLVSLERGSLEVSSVYEFPSLADFPSSPVFVPRECGVPGRSRYAGKDPGGHDGWVVCPVLSDDGFRVEVFDAGSVGAGPVATLGTSARTCLPFMLHSAWAPAAVSAPDAERLRFSQEVRRDVMSALSDADAAAVVRVAAELDEI
ncbi:MAG: carotenoid oxygenase family protein [Acidimicrobiales bacterium]|nr:carotenoid oxygenase family protein [Acidimicrobiales bacterium]